MSLAWVPLLLPPCANQIGDICISVAQNAVRKIPKTLLCEEWIRPAPKESQLLRMAQNLTFYTSWFLHHAFVHSGPFFYIILPIILLCILQDPDELFSFGGSLSPT